MKKQWNFWWIHTIFQFLIILSFIVIWCLYFYLKFFVNTPKKDDQNINNNTTQQSQQTNTQDNNTTQALEDLTSLVNKEWSEQKKILFIYSSEDKEVQENLQKVLLIPSQWMWFDNNDVWFINEKFSKFDAIKKEIDVKKWTPLLAIKSKDINDVLESLYKKHWFTEEQKSMFKVQFEWTTVTEWDWKIIRIWEYSIWWTNVCKEWEWKTNSECSEIVYVYDKRCQEEACSNENLNILKNITKEKTSYKEIEITQPEAQDYLKQLWSLPVNLPFMIYYKKDFEKNTDRLYDIAFQSKEWIKLTSDSYYLVPEFMKSTWKQWDKICTLDESLVTSNASEYKSCSDQSCSWKKECIQEEKNTADIYTMWYCPYCKDHVKQLSDLKTILKDTTFNVRYLTSFDPSKKVEDLKLSDFQALHWNEELQENARQICIKKEFWNDTLLSYLKSRFDSTYDPTNVEKNLTDTLKKLSLDQNKINECMQSKYVVETLYQDWFDATHNKVTWTPTWVINKKYKEQINANWIKEVICSHNQWIVGC